MHPLYGLVVVVLVLTLLVLHQRGTLARRMPALKLGLAALAVFAAIVLAVRFAPTVGYVLGVLGLSWIVHQMRTRQRAQSHTQSPGSNSSVQTDWLIAELEHASGLIDAEVLRGAFKGQRLSAMALQQLYALHVEMENDDALDSLQILESFLDQSHPDWEQPPGANQQADDPSADVGRMTTRRALDILGLTAGATKQEIKDAHRRLIRHVHPDRGGSSYLAAELNRAKDFLLAGH